VHRTDVNLERLKQLDINFATSYRDAVIQPAKDEKGNLLIELDAEIEGVELFYTFDNTYPDHHSSLYKKGEKLTIPTDADTFRVISYRDGKPAGKMITVSLAELEKRAN
jgi:hexosaminidase